MYWILIFRELFALFSVLCRRNAHHLGEHLPEVALVVVAHLQGHVLDGILGLGEELFGVLHPKGAEVADEALAGDLLEARAEKALAHGGHLEHGGEIQILHIVGVDILDCPAENPGGAVLGLEADGGALPEVGKPVLPLVPPAESGGLGEIFLHLELPVGGAFQKGLVEKDQQLLTAQGQGGDAAADVLVPGVIQNPLGALELRGQKVPLVVGGLDGLIAAEVALLAPVVGVEQHLIQEGPEEGHGVPVIDPLEADDLDAEEALRDLAILRQPDAVVQGLAGVGGGPLPFRPAEEPDGIPLELPDAGLGGKALQYPFQNLAEVFLFDPGLGDVVHHPQAHGLLDVVEVLVHGHDDDAELRVLLPDGLEKLHAGKAGHGKVGDHHVHRVGIQKFQGGPAVFRLAHHLHAVLFPIGKAQNLAPHDLLVVNDQNLSHSTLLC